VILILFYFMLLLLMYFIAAPRSSICRKTLGLDSGLLQRLYWQPEAQTAWLDHVYGI